MMGMGQQMPMRRPPMGPSPMTAGRPNPMAGFQGGAPQQGFQQRYAQNQANVQNQMQQYPQGGPQGMGGMINPMAQQMQGMFGGPPQGGDPSGMQGRLGQAVGGMSDAQMHPFAPRNQGAQFQPMQQPPPGAMGRRLRRRTHRQPLGHRRPPGTVDQRAPTSQAEE